MLFYPNGQGEDNPPGGVKTSFGVKNCIDLLLIGLGFEKAYREDQYYKLKQICEKGASEHEKL